MRISHVISTLAASSGGPTQIVEDLAAAQASAGHEVTVCTTDRDNPVSRRLPHENFEKFRTAGIDMQVFPVAFAPLLLSPRMAQWLDNTVQAFDIVHIHGLYRFPPTYAAIAARRRSVPYVVTPHGSLDPFLHEKSTTGHPLVKRTYEKLLEIPNLRRADAIHYTAEAERELAGYLALTTPSFVVPNGVSWERFRELPPRGRLRRQWGVGDGPVVLFLGRLHFKKGLDLLIEAFDIVRRRVPGAQLVVAGPDNEGYGDEVRRWIRERELTEIVHFVGPLHGPDVVQAYVDADVFALPSYTENFGLTVAEAMACRLPVVISDQVNIHEAVSSGGAGVVTRCDAGEVADAVVALLEDPGRRRALGNAGRKLVEERYTWPVIVTQLTEEYEAVIDRHHALRAANGYSRGSRFLSTGRRRAGKLLTVAGVPSWRGTLIRHRVAAGTEHSGVLRRLGPVRTVVDVGANRGQFSLAVRHCLPEARIIAFEPLPGPAEVFRRVFEGDARVRLVEAAVGPVSGEATIHLSGRDDSSSLLPITGRQATLFPGTGEVGVSTVRTVRLGEVLSAEELEAPALLKIDVQGFELEALAGCEDLLDHFAWVYVECSFVELYEGQALADEVVAWLGDRGFVLGGVHNTAYGPEGMAVQADFLFGRAGER